MSQYSQKKHIFTLQQVTESLRNTIQQAIRERTFWVKAEIAQVRFARSGHAYLELVELVDNHKVASMSAVIWSRDLQILKGDLASDFTHLVQRGSEIVFRTRIDFHPVFGLKLHIVEIDLSYALGALEKRKAETIEKLKENGLLMRNRSIPLPRIIQRVALITTPGSAASEDFHKHLLDNERGYKFELSLFPSTVQGEKAAYSLRTALLSIPVKEFDSVVFVRGGGSALDLEAFNDYSLCEAAANFNLPILTGIGHETDLSVLDMVAGSPHKTPTAIADFLLDRMLSFETEMARMLVHIARAATSFIKHDELHIRRFNTVLESNPINTCRVYRGLLNDKTTRLLRRTSEIIHVHKHKLQHTQSISMRLAHEKISVLEPDNLKDLRSRLFVQFDHRLKLQHQNLRQLHESVALLHPQKTLARGFSIARINGKSLTHVNHLSEGQMMETELLGGSITSEIKKITLKKNNE